MPNNLEKEFEIVRRANELYPQLLSHCRVNYPTMVLTQNKATTFAVFSLSKEDISLPVWFNLAEMRAASATILALKLDRCACELEQKLSGKRYSV